MTKTTLSVLQYPHPMLGYKCHRLKKVDKSIKTIAGEMIQVMHAENGSGLAASQVGFPFRMFVATHWKTDFAFINPVVSRAKKAKLVTKNEGCLSLTDLSLPVERWDKIRFRAWTPLGDDVDEIVTGDFARIIQHENDHLDGKLIIDRVSEFINPYLKQHVEKYKETAENLFNPTLGPNNIDRDLLNQLLETYCK